VTLNVGHSNIFCMYWISFFNYEEPMRWLLVDEINVGFLVVSEGMEWCIGG